ncbi:hypothetical protein BH23CHL7_BH23CHL7_07200 [soil metagenome]
MNSRVLERVLAAWFDVVQPARVPEGLLDEAFSVTRRTPQHGRRLARLQLAVAELTRPRSLSLSPALAMVLLLALLAAMMLAAAIIGGRLLNAPITPGWRSLGGVEDAIDGSVYVAGVASGPRGVVAIGNSLIEGDDGCRVHRGHAWSSADGRDWSLSETVFEDAALDSVVAGDDSYYALGSSNRRYEDVDGECQWRSGDQSLWRSLDGRQWTLLPELPVDEQDWWASVVEVDGAPIVVALHQEYVETEPGSFEPASQETRAWRFGDERWEPLSTIPGAFILDVAARDRLIAGIGFVDIDQQQSIAWASADGGRTWTEAEALPEGTQLFDVTAVGDGFVAVGPPGDEGPIVALSSDGLAWQTVRPDIRAPGGLMKAWTAEDGLVAVSESYEEISPDRCPTREAPMATPYLSMDPAAATQPGEPASIPPDVIAPDPDPPADCWIMRLEPRAWLSANGRQWTSGPGVPAVERIPVADPIPSPQFGGAVTSIGFVFSNPGYGAQVWHVPARDLLPAATP